MPAFVSRWMTVAAAVPGVSHEKKGESCQDAVHATRRDGVTVLALADGAGSVRYARQGAECATRCACGWIGRSFDALWDMEPADIATSVVQQALERLQPLARELSAATRDLASTLAFVAVKQGRYIAGNLGDGVIGCERQGQLDVLCHPRRGEFANQTYFLTSDHAAQCFEVKKGDCRDVIAFSLMSDGAAEAFYQRRDKTLSRGVQQVSRWLEQYPASRIARQLETNLREQVRARTDDDCSLAVLRHLSFPLDALRAKTPAYHSDFLGCGSAIGARNRLEVLQDLVDEHAGDTAVAAPAQVRTMTRRTVQKHVRALHSLLEFAAA
jgi:hypothetical protein